MESGKPFMKIAVPMLNSKSFDFPEWITQTRMNFLLPVSQHTNINENIKTSNRTNAVCRQLLFYFVTAMPRRYNLSTKKTLNSNHLSFGWNY